MVTEGVQQLFGFHDRYASFRSAWNALDRERRLFDSRAGRYANNPEPDQTLAERIDDLLGQETSAWAAGMTGHRRSLQCPAHETDCTTNMLAAELHHRRAGPTRAFRRRHHR
ncbi:MAG: hypothetical protein M3256_25540 [Actinomycetota bacterium]|nr:hypothetical protein [Actinomycetota bacterium]